MSGVKTVIFKRIMNMEMGISSEHQEMNVLCSHVDSINNIIDFLQF